jgi:hypothetical protein
LNSPPILFYPPSSNLRNSFNRYLFSIYIHMYILFTPYSSLTPFPYLLPLPQVSIPPRPLPPYCSPVLRKKEKEMTFLLFKNSYIGPFLVALTCIFVLPPDLVHFLYFSS